MNAASVSRFRVTVDDLRHYDWQEILSQQTEKDCFSFYRALSARASELKEAGDDLGQRVFGLLFVVASFHPTYDSRMSPYRSLWISGDNRSFNPDDLADADLTTLQGILAEIVDPEFRARVGDVVWICKRDYKAAQVAVRAFVESARVLETDHLWGRFVERLERAAQLAGQLGFGKPLHLEVLAEVEATIARFDANERAGRLCACLMRILLEHEGGDAQHYASLSEALAQRLAAAGEWDFAQEYWQTATSWFRRLKDEAEINRCELAAAECMVSKAEAIAQIAHLGFSSAAHWMAVGLVALRQARAEPARIRAVHAKLLEFQGLVRSELSPMELDEDDIPGFREERKKAQ